MSLSFNPTHRIQLRLLFERTLLAVWKCRDSLGTRRKLRVNRSIFRHKRQASIDSLASVASIERMRGRGDGRFQPRGGGRGRGGRGQFEAQKTLFKQGRKPEVGAYLDLPRGQAADPEAVLKWLECFRVYMYSTYESRIKEIIGIDGVLNDYPDLKEPDDPVEGASVVAIERWKTAVKKYDRSVELLELDCFKLYGDLLGKMSEGSKIRIKEMPAGERAMEECDPLGLLTCVVATHMNNKRYGETYNITTAVKNFYANKMLHNEDLATYYSRCRTLLFVKSEAYRLADEEPPIHTDEYYTILFITSLNSNFSDYILNFKTKVRAWPQTMGDANADAANYLMSRPITNGNPPAGEKRNMFAANRGGRAGSGGRGGRGRLGGEKSESETKGYERKGRAGTPYRERDVSPHGDNTVSVQEYGTRYGRCNHCNEEGHYAYECRKQKKSAGTRNPSSEK